MVVLTRTALMATLLMLVACIAMIMLNLTHAHSQLDSLQAIVEDHSRDLEAFSRTSQGINRDLRFHSNNFEGLKHKAETHQGYFQQQEQRIATLSDRQRQSNADLARTKGKLEELAPMAELWKIQLQLSGVTKQQLALQKDNANLREALESLSARVQSLQTEIAQASVASGGETMSSTARRGLLMKDAQGKSDYQTRVQQPGQGGLALVANVPQSQTLLSPGSASGQLTFVDKIGRLIWFRECGCTGIEVEAVTLLQGLAAIMGVGRIRTNRCEMDQSCAWPAHTRKVLDTIEVAEDDLFPSPNRGHADGNVTIIVIHAAYLGVCGMSENLEMVLQGPAGKDGLVLVSRSMVEVDALEDGVIENCNYRFDAVLVPSQQSSDVFASAFAKVGVKTHRMKILSEPVDTTLFNCSGPPRTSPSLPSFGLAKLNDFFSKAPHQTFTFLSSFKWEERKNWRSLIENFIAAFPNRYTVVDGEAGKENVFVRLLMKSQVPSWSTDPDSDIPQLFQTLGKLQADFEDRLLLFREVLPTNELPKLYHAADAFVLPTHGEGWGLPLIEAMASGLPTIATGWGGQMDFMNEGNSWPVRYKIVNRDDGTAGRWAEPEPAALQQAMLEAVAGGAKVRKKTENACKEIPQRFATQQVAASAAELLVSLAASAKGSSLNV
eukprot:TRINITY_DN31726_c0_g1_i1.p1 TRINITY_DN31726_c0_g1~~TRINITY_DN31726_c0_g1_i1.p1  ORF type:complete len:665 (+),score=90.75 TRINITY_DN31726_c0_g1_i1:87-2081(+)